MCVEIRIGTSALWAILLSVNPLCALAGKCYGVSRSSDQSNVWVMRNTIFSVLSGEVNQHNGKSCLYICNAAAFQIGGGTSFPFICSGADPSLIFVINVRLSNCSEVHDRCWLPMNNREFAERYMAPRYLSAEGLLRDVNDPHCIGPDKDPGDQYLIIFDLFRPQPGDDLLSRCVAPFASDSVHEFRLKVLAKGNECPYRCTRLRGRTPLPGLAFSGGDENQLLFQCGNFTGIIPIVSAHSAFPAIGGDDDLLLRKTENDYGSGFSLGLCQRYKHGKKYRKPVNLRAKQDEASMTTLIVPNMVEFLIQQIYLSWRRGEWFEIVAMITN